MASQTTKIIDVTRSYVPVDPDAFPNNMMFTPEDRPEQAKPIVPFEGYNFMPTAYGYKSYFGITSKLDIDALPSQVDYILILQSNTFINKAIALCDDGIWSKEANATGAWVHDVSLDIPAAGVHYDWSYCFLDNDFFCYRSTSDGYYRHSSMPRTVTEGEIASALPTVLDPTTVHPADTFYKVIPTFLNMAGQMGMFKAGSRLGFWDSANSISWSSIDDYAEFTPAVLTQAGSAIFLEVQGRIVNIISMTDGFVVYSTKSITLIARDESSTMQWNPVVLLKDSGIAFKRESCGGGGDGSIQFANTTVGLVKIENNKATTIIEEVSDLLKESQEPVFLTLIGGRYLFLEILDSNYLDGLVHFTVQTIPTTEIVYPATNPAYNQEAIDTVDSVFNGTNAELQALIDAYLASQALPPRGLLSTYTPIMDATVSDNQIVQALSEGLPYFAPQQYSIQDPVSGLVRNCFFGYDFGPDYVVEINYPGGSGLTYSKEGGWVGSLPVLNPGPDNSGSIDLGSVSALYQYQLNRWAANDKVVQDMLNYIMLYRESKATGLRLGYWKVGHIHYHREHTCEVVEGTSTTVWNSGTVVAQVSADNLYNIILEQDGTLYTRFPAEGVYPGESFTLDSSWTIPTLVFQGNEVVIRRHRNTVSTVYGRISVSYAETNFFTAPKAGDFCFCVGDEVWSSNVSNKAWVAEVTANPVAYAANVYGTEGNTIQEARATIAGFNYLDIDGIEQYVAWNESFSLPPITPFYYQDAGGVVTLPPSSFLLQDGSVGPVYPTIPGALVYDLHLKKWGKMKQEYKVLVDWSPLNNLSGNTIPYEVFGIEGGILQLDGKIALFDKYPIDSYIKYGKIGYHRQGMTSAEEVRISFRDVCTGIVRTEASLDGTSIELGLTKTEEFTNTRNVVMYPSTTGRWHTVSIIGIYDIKHLEFRGTKVGNR